MNRFMPPIPDATNLIDAKELSADSKTFDF
jgi:hypothetical protein